MLNLKLSLLAAITFFSGCIVIPTYTAHISLKPTNLNAQEVQVGKVLLIGTGSVASRVFLDNLSTEMIRSFKDKGIPSEFSYMGKVAPSVPLKLDSLVSAEFDTYLVFKATTPSYLNMTKQKYTAFGPGTVATGYGNQYTETYTITLYKNGQPMQMIWQGDLNVDFDLANDSRYKQISKLIFGELVKNHILLN